MKDSLNTVKHDEFGKIEKKYSKPPGSRMPKRPRTTRKSLANESDVVESDADDTDFKSQSTVSISSSGNKSESEELSNAEVRYVASLCVAIINTSVGR